jgi:MYXO-CTERM domain-containing protein
MPQPSLRAVRLSLIAAGAIVAGLAAPVPRAQACGGFFCNQSSDPNNLPVAQTAENVLFAMDRTANGDFQLEAHVQIFYSGPADKFSWIVPVDSQPVISVGSNAIFNSLLALTQPRFGLEWSTEGTCRPIQQGVGNPSSGNGPGASASSSGGASGSSSPPGVDIAFRGDVGPYGAAVIKSTDPQDSKPVIDWLNENQYFVTSEGARLIADYVRQEKYFVAIKLLPQKGVNEILPLVMRFTGPGPCIPLKLTAIAALADLKINLWVLADQRVVPDNVYEMEINPARINWFDGGSNYDELVKGAANEAGGNAFVTEYAGPTSIFKNQVYQARSYNLDAIRAATTPPEALDLIGSQPFPRDSTLLELLRRQIPEPAALKAMNIDERTFYNQLRSYWDQYKDQFAPFDAAKLAADLEMTFIAGLEAGQRLLDSHPRLTRLSTFISPEEMTVDPTFTMNSSLPDVPLQRTAHAVRVCGDQRYDACGAPVRLELPDGQAIWMIPSKDSQTYCYGQAWAFDRAKLDQLPALYRGWVRSSAGEGMAKIDNDAAIRKAVTTHNVNLAGPLPGAVPRGLPPLNGDPSGGCSCRTSPSGGPGPLALLLGLAIWAARRRRRG